MSATATGAAPVRRVNIGGITGGQTAFFIALGALALLLLVPLAHSDYINNLFRGILMYSAMSYGWNLIGGYTGYVSFGNVVFFGIGGYVSAMFATHGMTDIAVCILSAMIVAAAFAVAVGLPVLRLKGHYFGIATLGVALATQEIVANLDVFGGSSGLSPKAATLAGIALPYVATYYAMWVVCLISVVGTYIIARSRLGYAFVAIRENEDAAAVLGIDPTKYKVTAWALSAMMGAGAGAVFIFSNSFIDPSVAFSIDNNVFPIVMALLGGVGTVAGPLTGAFLLTAINETLWNKFPYIHTLFFGAVIVLVVIFLPRGLLFLLRAKRGWRGLLDGVRTFRV